MRFGSPKILECDKDSEFQDILLLIYCLHPLKRQKVCTYVAKLFNV